MSSARSLNRNAALSNDRERHRWAGQLCADLLYEAHPRLGQATRSLSKRKLQMENRTTGTHRPTAYDRGACRMETQTDARRAFVEAIMNRLRRHYAEQTPLPGNDETQTLSLAQLQRLYRHVMSEGYGE